MASEEYKILWSVQLCKGGEISHDAIMADEKPKLHCKNKISFCHLSSVEACGLLPWRPSVIAPVAGKQSLTGWWDGMLLPPQPGIPLSLVLESARESPARGKKVRSAGAGGILSF